VVKTKSLRLDRQIQISRDQSFTVNLRWRDDNTFEVLSYDPRPV
jgi:hypothetical protein